jgi:hypothetical protein
MLTLGEIAATLVGLRPIPDPVLDLVRADCPVCFAGSTDPQGLWRPLVVLVDRRSIVLRCDACGEVAR